MHPVCLSRHACASQATSARSPQHLLCLHCNSARNTKRVQRAHGTPCTIGGMLPPACQPSLSHCARLGISPCGILPVLKPAGRRQHRVHAQSTEDQLNDRLRKAEAEAKELRERLKAAGQDGAQVTELNGAS